MGPLLFVFADDVLKSFHDLRHRRSPRRQLAQHLFYKTCERGRRPWCNFCERSRLKIEMLLHQLADECSRKRRSTAHHFVKSHRTNTHPSAHLPDCFRTTVPAGMYAGVPNTVPTAVD